MKLHIPSTKAFLIVVMVAYLVLAVAALITKASEVLTEDTAQIQFTTPGMDKPNCDVGHPADVLAFIGYEVTPTNLDAYYFDTNQDGHADFKVLIPHGDINRYPLFYVETLNDNETGLLIYVDKQRDGTCGEIEVYVEGGSNRQEVPLIDQHGQRDRREPT